MKALLLATAMGVLVATWGTAIADEAHTTPYMAMEVQITGQDFIGLVPEGIRFDGHTKGVVTDGLLVGASLTAVDYLPYRHDGVGVVDVRGFGVHPDGTTAAMTMKGFLGEPMPGMIEAMLDPAFEPPDVDFQIHGAAWFQTMATQYAFLNHTVFGCAGTINSAEGGVRITCRSLAP